MTFDNQNKIKNTAKAISEPYFQPCYEVEVVLKNGLYSTIQFETEEQAMEFYKQNQRKGV